jgi:cellulase/cellobiase CelA1
VLVSALALTVSLLQVGTPGENVAARDTAGERPTADPSFSAPPTARPSPGEDTPGATSTSRPAETTGPTATRGDRDTAPQGEPSGTLRKTPGAGSAEPAADCEVAYDVVNEWPDGFQATVTVTSEAALHDWRVAWTFGAGQRVTQMWDASVTQHGTRVTATAADYNKTVPADGTLTFGFLGSMADANPAPYGFTLNGESCGVAG